MAPAPVARARSPVYATDMAGKAASCVAPEVTAAEGKEASGTIATGGGGWCGLLVNRNGSPFAVGVLTQAPTRGKVYVHTVGDDTRIDYTPYAGKLGPDTFTVRLIPGDAIVNVAVNTPAATPAAANPPAATGSK